MRHRNKGRKLGRTKAPRVHLLANLAQSVILYEKVRTTEAKAKEVRSVVERLITVGKKSDVATRRQLLRRLPTELAVKKVIEVLGPRYAKRAGGYTRIVKIGPRQGDAAKMAVIELV
jgi:large subunit ribosomal protein L17